MPCGLGLINGPIHRRTSEVRLHGAESGDSIGDHQLDLVVVACLSLCLALVIRVCVVPTRCLALKEKH